MQFSTYALYAAATSTLVLAAPTQEFHVGFSVGKSSDGTPILAAPRLVSGDGQPAGQFLLEARALSEGLGLPASLVGDGRLKDLFFDTTSIFGDGRVVAYVQPVYNTAGAVHPVVAYEGTASDPHWAIASKKEIVHSKHAASNTFFLCKQSVGGQEASVLSYGNPTADGKAPEGCEHTTIYKN